MSRMAGRSGFYGVLVRLVAGAIIVIPGLVAIGIILNGNYW